MWALDPFQVYSAGARRGDRRLLIQGARRYNAETTVSPDGSRLVFTSTRDGDLELYTARVDGSRTCAVSRTRPGYDGGAFFSPDAGRGSRGGPAGRRGAELEDYRALLARGLVRPTALEIMVAGSEGQNVRAVTRNGKANFAPSYLHDSRRVIFASEHRRRRPRRAFGRRTSIFTWSTPTRRRPWRGVPRIERITFYDGFDGFPMFSPDGELLAFASNRFGSAPGETNVFVARWVE